jgi:hypothetical protein
MSISAINNSPTSYQAAPVRGVNDGDADDLAPSSTSAPRANDHDADDRMPVSSAIQRTTSSAAAALTALQEVG